MPAVTVDDIARMRDQLFFEGPDRARKISRYWLLLPLSAVIAAAGVLADSTATVIGAMIVAPLMTPILGIVLAIVLADRRNLVRSLLLVVAGAATVVAIAWVLGTVTAVPALEATNGQVASRVHPRLVDLLAAVATGAVGAVALTRSDISDTLPGVAIAISLVPPLAVVGLTLHAGAPDQALGALLLFVTNVTAILLSGVVVMAIFKVASIGDGLLAPAVSSRRHRRRAIAVVIAAVAVVIVPLAGTSQRIAVEAINENRVQDTVSAWAAEADWKVDEVTSTDSGISVRVVGPVPEPDTTTLRDRLDAAGLAGTTVEVELLPEQRVVLEATR